MHVLIFFVFFLKLLKVLWQVYFSVTCDTWNQNSHISTAVINNNYYDDKKPRYTSHSVLNTYWNQLEPEKSGCSIYYVLQLIFSDRQKPAVFPVPHVDLYSQGKRRKHSLPFTPSVPEQLQRKSCDSFKTYVKNTVELCWIQTQGRSPKGAELRSASSLLQRLHPTDVCYGQNHDWVWLNLIYQEL